jgi:hypothetical protein
MLPVFTRDGAEGHGCGGLVGTAVSVATVRIVVLATETTLFGAVPVTCGLVVKPATHGNQFVRFAVGTP